MSTQKKQWAAIIIMIALFGMIAFVTNLCSPMALILKNQFGIPDSLAQIGNIGNFAAYLIMGIPSGMLISKLGYKKTALIALVVGIIGILIQWVSGLALVESNTANFIIYLIGALVAGCTMCMLNCVVNPMLNLLGGGGNKGNQYIQIGGVFNSTCAVAIYIIMGALIGEVTKDTQISAATPALFIAIAIFAIAFIIIAFTKIEEPEQEKTESQIALIKGACKYRHFVLGAIAIFLYMGVEVGVPTTMINYLSAPESATLTGAGIAAEVATLIAAVYWIMMLIGRFVGASIGGKVSSRTLITIASVFCIILVALGIFNMGPTAPKVTVIGINWATLTMIYPEVPMGVLFFILVGLCTSVMWGAIFNLAVEGLGKYTAIAAGIFMTMVFGCAVLMPFEAWFAEIIGTYKAAYVVIIVCAAYLLFYALIGSRVKKVKAANE